MELVNANRYCIKEGPLSLLSLGEGLLSTFRLGEKGLLTLEAEFGVAGGDQASAWSTGNRQGGTNTLPVFVIPALSLCPVTAGIGLRDI